MSGFCAGGPAGAPDFFDDEEHVDRFGAASDEAIAAAALGREKAHPVPPEAFTATLPRGRRRVAAGHEIMGSDDG
jgi:hypothetical protein